MVVTGRGKGVLVGWRGRGVLGSFGAFGAVEAVGTGEVRGWGMWTGRVRS
jgi:hypothetical protein